MSDRSRTLLLSVDAAVIRRTWQGLDQTTDLGHQ